MTPSPDLVPRSLAEEPAPLTAAGIPLLPDVWLSQAMAALHKEDEQALMALIEHRPAPEPATLALRRAAQDGQAWAVQRLLPIADAQAAHSLALSLAAQEGHLDVVQLLLPVSEPKADHSAALRHAARNGFEAIVTLLLPVSDPGQAHAWAVRYQESAAMERLKAWSLDPPLENTSAAPTFRRS